MRRGARRAWAQSAAAARTRAAWTAEALQGSSYLDSAGVVWRVTARVGRERCRLEADGADARVVHAVTAARDVIKANIRKTRMRVYLEPPAKTLLCSIWDISEREKAASSRAELEHTAPQKIASSEERAMEANAPLRSEHAFNKRSDALNYFTEVFGFPINRSTFGYWIRGHHSEAAGGRRKLGEANDEELLHAVLFADKYLWLATHPRTIDLANRMLPSGCKAMRFGHKKTRDWAQAFGKRKIVAYPHLWETLSGLAADSRLLARVNPHMIKSWFGKFAQLAMEYKFGERREDSVGEFEWLCPERVIITDEMSVSGGALRGGSQGTGVATLDDRVELVRRCKEGGSSQHEDCQSRITIVAGHTLTGHTTLPIWVLGQALVARKSSLNSLRRAAGSWTFRDRTIGTPVIGVSETGGLAGAQDIAELMVCAIKAMYPDVAPEDGKRVLWFTASPECPLGEDLHKALRAKGIVVAGWLPTLPIDPFPSPEFRLFWPFESKMRELHEDWERKRKKTTPTKVDEIKFAKKALEEIFTVDKCRETVRRAGMNPVDCTVLLQRMNECSRA